VLFNIYLVKQVLEFVK